MRLRDFTLRKLRVESLTADIPDCRYDYALARSQGQMRLSRSGVGTGEVVIRESDLADYIVAKYAEIKACTVEVRDGIVWVEGDGDFLVVKTKFAVIAKLGTIDGSQLVLTDAKVYFDWRRVDPMSAQILLQTLNPVVEFDNDLGLYDAVSVREIELEEGKITARGSTKIPVRPSTTTASKVGA